MSLKKLMQRKKMSNRPSEDEYFMNLALTASTRATCKRLIVGCVIVKDGYVISTGYNGSPSGVQHCIDVGCKVKDNHCIATIHAEDNAILQCAKRGVCCDESKIYVTHFPCWNCFNKLISVGIREIIYKDDYKNDENVVKLSISQNIKIRKYFG